MNTNKDLVIALQDFGEIVNKNAHKKGFYDLPDEIKVIEERVTPEVYSVISKAFKAADTKIKMSLISCEVAEMIEAVRAGNPPDKKLPEFSELEIEAADVFIRLLDFCVENEIDLGVAALSKAGVNSTRPYKHGKKF